ncbi:MAG: hypothetical protein ACYCST_18080 [Acidimicrobiales bacterium]
MTLEGLSGSETNPAPDGTAVVVHEVDKSAPNAYYWPGADPGEGFAATNAQLFGSAATAGEPTNQGLVTDYAATLARESKDPGWESGTNWGRQLRSRFPHAHRLPMTSSEVEQVAGLNEGLSVEGMADALEIKPGIPPFSGLAHSPLSPTSCLRDGDPPWADLVFIARRSEDRLQALHRSSA